VAGYRCRGRWKGRHGVSENELLSARLRVISTASLYNIIATCTRDALTAASACETPFPTLALQR
jgi:hypothetical protein